MSRVFRASCKSTTAVQYYGNTDAHKSTFRSRDVPHAAADIESVPGGADLIVSTATEDDPGNSQCVYINKSKMRWFGGLRWECS
jgi:hypothetical protein